MTSDPHIFDTLKKSPELAFVNAGWATFTIKLVNGLKEGDHDCWGVCDFDTYEILLDKKLSFSDAVAKETLFHEICHLLLETFGLGIPEGDSSELLLVNNEKLTITMSRAVILFASLNPDLSKLLLL